MFLSKSSRKYSFQCRAFPGEHISATLPVDGTTCCKLHDMMMLVCQSLRVMITASTPSRQHSMLPQHRGNNQWPLLQHCRSRELSSSCKSAKCATRHAHTEVLHTCRCTLQNTHAHWLCCCRQQQKWHSLKPAIRKCCQKTAEGVHWPVLPQLAACSHTCNTWTLLPS